MKNIWYLFLVISVNLFGQKELDQLLQKWNKKNIPYMSVETLALPKTKAILLDARDKEEYKISHLETAIRVGYKDFMLKKTIAKLPKDKTKKIVVYCSLGIRSETIAHKLVKEGYTNVYNLYGGIFEWKNANFNVVDSVGRQTEKVHTYSKHWGKWLKKGKKVY